MNTKISFDNLTPGMELTPLVKRPTTRQLVMWAGASWAFDEYHYDRDFAVEYGLPDIIVQGALKAAFLAQLLTDWIGEAGVLRELNCKYQGMDFPDEEITCRGRIVNRQNVAGEIVIELEMWTENPRGKKTTRGTARVALY